MHNIKPEKRQLMTDTSLNTEIRQEETKLLKNAVCEEVKEVINKQTIRILYKNWKGETSIRNIIPCGTLKWGSTEYHKEEQWLMEAYDLEKGSNRTFAFKDIKYIIE